MVKALDHQHDRFVALKIRTVRRRRRPGGAAVRGPGAARPSPRTRTCRWCATTSSTATSTSSRWTGSRAPTSARLLHDRGRPGLGPSVVLPWLADAAVRAHPPPRAAPAGGPRRREAGQPRAHRQRPGGARRLRAVVLALVRATTGRDPWLRGARARRRRRAEPRASDVYSLAATAFTLLTGEPPTGVRPAWDGIDPEQAAELEEAIRVGLATDPARRPESRRRAGRAAARRLAARRCRPACSPSASPTSWARPRSGRPDPATCRGRWRCTTTSSRRRPSATAAASSRRRARATRPSRCTRPPVRRSSAAIDIVNGLAATVLAQRPPARGPRRHPHRRDRPAPRRLRRPHAQHGGPAARAGRGRRGLRLAGRPPGSWQRHLPDGSSLVDLGPAPPPWRAATRGRLRRRRARASHAPPPPDECPYPGLLSFTAEDADRFFGREEVVADIVDRACAPHPFLAVVGASGSGKSSVLRAGVGPAPRHRRRHHARRRSRWPRSSDGRRPARRRPVRGAVHPGRRRRRAHGVPRPAARLAAPGGDRPAGRLLRRLRRASAAWPTRWPQHQVLLGPMAPDELRRAITEPASARRPEDRARPRRRARRQGRRRAGRAAAAVPRAAVDVGGARRAHAHPRGLPRRPAGWRAPSPPPPTAPSTPSTRWTRRSPAGCSSGSSSRARARRTHAGGRSCSELLPAGGDESRMDKVLDALVGRPARHDGRDRRRGRPRGAHPRVAAPAGVARRGPRRLRLQRHLTAAATAWDQRGQDPSELYRGTTARRRARLARHRPADLRARATVPRREPSRRGAARSRAAGPHEPPPARGASR